MCTTLPCMSLTHVHTYIHQWTCNVHVNTHTLMSYVGTDEKALIEVICYRSNAQRQELKLKYKSMYGRVGVAT